MDEAKTLTNPNKTAGNAAEMKRAAAALDPLGVMPAVGHLLPVDLTAEAKRAEDGARPLKGKREEFCRVLTGWGGDGRRKKNCEAYERVYGKGGATARTQSSWLLAIPEVKARVEYLERKVEEAKRHDYLAAQQEIDELRLTLVARAQTNSKLAAVGLAAARDFEAAHGLGAAKGGGGGETASLAAIEASDGLNAVRAILAKVYRPNALLRQGYGRQDGGQASNPPEEAT